RLREVLGGDHVADCRELDGGADGVVGFRGRAHPRDYAAVVRGLPLRGGCLCGGVRYEIDEELVSASYCHCTRCQRRTGTAASPEGRIVPGSLRILQGEELVKEWKSERGVGDCFC